MKKAFKISMILLLMGLTGTGSAAVMDFEHDKAGKDFSLILKEKEKKKAKDAEQPESGEPFFRTNESVVSMNMLNLDTGPVEVKIYDDHQRVLYNEVITGESSVGKRFDFSQVTNGVYTIVVSDEHSQYFKKVDKW